jgi:uncharacterized protein YoxC
MKRMIELYEKTLLLQKAVNEKLDKNDSLRIRVNSLVNSITPLYDGLKKSWDMLSPQKQALYDKMEENDPMLDEFQNEIERLTDQVNGKPKTMFEI